MSWGDRQKTWVKRSRHLTLFLKKNMSHFFSFHASLSWSHCLGHCDPLSSLWLLGAPEILLFFSSPNVLLCTHALHECLLIPWNVPLPLVFFAKYSLSRLRSWVIPWWSLTNHYVELTLLFFASTHLDFPVAIIILCTFLFHCPCLHL